MATLLRPLIRLLVGFIAIPLFRLFLRRVGAFEAARCRAHQESRTVGPAVRCCCSWATDNFEYAVFGEYLSDWKHQYIWLSLGLRLLLAVGVIESMPDQALFSIIHPGPERLLFPKGQRIKAAREQFWPFCKGMFFRHLDRSSSVFAIMAVIFGLPRSSIGRWVVLLGSRSSSS